MSGVRIWAVANPVEHLVEPWVNIWEYLMANPKTIVPVSIHVGMFEWTCECLPMWEKLLRQLMSARDAFSKVPFTVRFYRQHQFSSPSTVWETPNQVLRFLLSVFQMLLCALFPHVRTRVRFLGGKFVRTLKFPSASPSRCNLFLLTHSRHLEVRLSLHQKQTSIQRSRFHEPGKSTH